MSLRGLLSRLGLGLCVTAGAGAVLPATAAALTYSTPGEHILTVPGGVTAIRIEAAGGGGGLGASDTGCTPGKGGSVSGTFSVTPGSTVLIWVGGKGGDGTLTTFGGYGYGGRGGFNGGANGGTAYDVSAPNAGGGGGGGASEVAIASGATLLVAGGGGGCGGIADNRTQKLGDGGNDGSPGVSGEVATGGGAGTPNAPGEGGQSALSGGGTAPNGSPGSGMNGGAGATSYLFPAAGGGGGGGYYGGGGGGGSGGAGSSGGGGGGSDYVDSTGSNTSVAAGTTAGDGAVTIQCAAAGTTGSAADHALGAQLAASTGGCPLNVKIGVVGGPRGTKDANAVQSGADLSSAMQQDGLDLHAVTLRVTVTDVWNDPVPNADVTVLAGGFTGHVPSYPSGAPGVGHLCSEGGRCASGTLSGLKTGSKGSSDGTVDLTYWPPGIVPSRSYPQGHVTIGANATAHAPSCSCSEQSGNAKPLRLTIEPNQYGKTRDGSLKYHEQVGLIEALVPVNWAKIVGGEALKEATKTTLEAAYKALAESEKFALEAPGLDAIALAAFQVIKEYEEKKLEPEREATAEVLNALDVVDSGLGYPYLGLLSGDAVAGSPFLDAFAGRSGSGMLSRLAHKLDHLLETGHLLPRYPLPLRLRIFEVSYCPPATSCGQRNPGKPFLDFNFAASPHGEPAFSEDVVTPYAPNLWVQAQTHLDKK